MVGPEAFTEVRYLANVWQNQARDHQGHHRLAAGHGIKIGALGITSIRPFELEAVRGALRDARRVVVLERAWPWASAAKITEQGTISSSFVLPDAMLPRDLCRRPADAGPCRRSAKAGA